MNVAYNRSFVELIMFIDLILLLQVMPSGATSATVTTTLVVLMPNHQQN